MPKFGKKSKEHLRNLHPDIVLILNTAIREIDFSITCSIRDKETQNRYYDSKPQLSKLRYPKSKHNVTPKRPLAEAVDIYRYIKGYGVSFNKSDAYFLAGHIIMVAKNLDINIRWGGKWGKENIPLDKIKFKDLGHFELC